MFRGCLLQPDRCSLVAGLESGFLHLDRLRWLGRGGPPLGDAMGYRLVHCILVGLVVAVAGVVVVVYS